MFALISKCGMARVREELKSLDSVINLLVQVKSKATTAVPQSSALTCSQVHPAISMALLDAVRWHVHGYDK
jgi:hypothetical protein